VQWVREFFQEIDGRWGLATGTKVRLRIIGSVALMLQTDYARGTKDGDVLETSELTPEIQAHLLELAGKGTPIHVRHKLYIDIVANGIPLLPQAPVFHSVDDLNPTLVHFDIEVLDVVDVVVSKLKRFNPNDATDIEAMVEKGLVPHERLVERFRGAVESFQYDARGEDLPKYIRAFHRVERDMLGVPETEIELPDWL
jgi:hypothetical protein